MRGIAVLLLAMAGCAPSTVDGGNGGGFAPSLVRADALIGLKRA